ncbi:MAG TPA: M23 family metallopeptidase [Burkholderiaceae bacterium]
MNPQDKLISIRSAAGAVFNAVANSSRKTRIVTASAVLLSACAFGAVAVAPISSTDNSGLVVRAITEDLPLPDLSQQVASLEEQHFVQEEKVRAGDTLAAMLARLGVDDKAAFEFIKGDKVAHGVMQLRPGKRIQAETSENGQLNWLRATMLEGKDSAPKTLLVERKGDRFVASLDAAKLERRVEMNTVEIKSSLFAATDAAQIPDSVAAQIVDMFSTNIDFASDLQRGDRFNIVYETFWQDGELVRSGRILAGQFENALRTETHQAVWFDEPGSKAGGSYYSFDGKSLKKAFLKSPLEFSRISSVFSLRKHPISGMWKQHKGVDFAAGTGTPIRAAADGTIDFAGGQGGYGNVVVIKHWDNITTAYAHMSRFGKGVRKGMAVSQGEVIGYVGTTGWSTGPHLHYEFRVGNQPRDPLGVAVANSQPLAGGDLQRFHAVATDMKHRFALLRPQERGQMLAVR